MRNYQSHKKRTLNILLIIIGVMSALTIAGVTVSRLSAGEPGDMPPEPMPEMENLVDSEPTGYFHCQVEMQWDLHQVDAFFGIVEAYPSDGAQWPAIETKSHTAETLGYTLIQIRGLSVPSQFADRSQPLIFTVRERQRFNRAMEYVWALISQSETLILRNPEVIEGHGAVVCDVFARMGGHDLNLAEMMKADGHARPAGNWIWGARDVYLAANENSGMGSGE